jgi:hypothetical protein
VPRIIISDQFLMWSELFALWSIVSYGITADPLPEDADGVTFKWQTWRWALVLRIVVAIVFSYWICHSVIVSAWLTRLQRLGGGAHSGVWHRIDDHFGMGIPETKAINPFSKNDWAEIGVEPDVKVKAADALVTAEKLAESKLQKK